METHPYPNRKIGGGPVKRIPTNYEVEELGLDGHLAIVKRTRTVDGQKHVAYAVAMAETPITSNGHQIAAAWSVGRGKRRKVRDPESWIASREKAQAIFDNAVARGVVKTPNPRRFGAARRWRPHERQRAA